MAKLSSEELSKLIQLRQEYNNIIFEIGELTIQIEELEERLHNLKDEKINYVSTYKTLSSKDRELAKELTDKYGSGNIDLQTGEIS